MTKNIGLDQAMSFINCQLRAPAGLLEHQTKPAVTVSRMTGSGGHSVAAALAEYMEAKAAGHCAWTVFDRNLVEKVLEDHELPKRLAGYMSESHKPMVADALEELLGLHPSSWTLIQQTAETIWRLAQMGHVILVGRGANLITAKLATVFHVRLIGSLEKRVARVQESTGRDVAAALAFVKAEDGGRKHYIHEHFGKDINDPLLYHLVVNTDQLSYEATAALIGEAVIEHFHLGRTDH